ncbi:MAG: hypothetical protein J6P28_03780 [Treponema sp.]|nr:hypothetical protein [Treponema sp.]
MSMSGWAENEVRIACKKENPDWNGTDFDYGCGCYQSALKAYKSLCEDGHSNNSFAITRGILIRLMNGQPLTPIEDTEDTWSEINFKKEDYTEYQCSRMSSLFKKVYKDGTVKYHDVERAVAYDTSGNGYIGSVTNIIDDMFPITMPYYPPTGRFKLYTEEFSAIGFPRDNEDYNTRAIHYVVTPEGERVNIGRYFADTEEENMVEITKEEYEERLKKRAKPY